MIDHRQTERIKEFLRTERFTDKSLIDDLVDHLSCEIESRLAGGSTSFEEAFELAKQKLLPNEPLQVQKDLEILTTKTQNIMIKKTAYIGGYVSALLFSLAILFAVLSFQNESLVDSRRESMNEQYLTANLEGNLSKEETTNFYQDFYNETSRLKLQAISQSSTSQVMLIISILIFGLTYLPYRFYASFKRSELELT